MQNMIKAVMGHMIRGTPIPAIGDGVPDDEIRQNFPDYLSWLEFFSDTPLIFIESL